MDRDNDERQDRQEPERAGVAEQRPILSAQSDLERWNKLPAAERFQQRDYQRWAQNFRSRESLSESGKEGYRAMLAKYGKEYLHDRMADKRRVREEPRSLAERRMVRMLGELGQREDRSEYGGTYHREHKLAPSRQADFGWPEQHKAIDVWGGVHTRQFFVSQERVREANQRQIDRAKAAGWQLMIVTDEELRRESWNETRERVRRFLA